ncbi:MAG: class I SAM-dependent methyltransferase [Acidimicrobiia bacterium]
MEEPAVRERRYWDDVYRATGVEHFKYLWSKEIEGLSYVGRHFRRLVGHLTGKKILSLGGGIDRLAVLLAKNANDVVSVDVSPVAVAATIDLAEQEGVSGRLTALVGTAEETLFPHRSFDAVIAKRALHHMDFATVLTQVHDLLVSGGVLIAEEPICLSRWLSWLHSSVPFHPRAPRTQDERELTNSDLMLITRSFREVTISYFDVLARESVAYLLCKARCGGTLNQLGQIDYFLTNRCLPALRYLSTYVILQATK